MKTARNTKASKTNSDLAIVIAFESTTLRSWEPAYADLKADAEAAANRLAAK